MPGRAPPTVRPPPGAGLSACRNSNRPRLSRGIQPMPTFQYEAMDHTGREVKDTIDASTQEEAQQLIRQKGFFVTKISERAKAGAATKRKSTAKKKGQG